MDQISQNTSQNLNEDYFEDDIYLEDNNTLFVDIDNQTLIDTLEQIDFEGNAEISNQSHYISFEMEKQSQLQDSLVVNSFIDEEIEKSKKEDSIPVDQNDIKLNPIQNFEIRQYQLQLYYEGKGKNCIVYMETGTGKTLVLVMLMWHQLCKQKNKQVIFIGNTIQLVEQQARYFKNQIYQVSDLLQEEYSIINKQERLKFVKKIISQVTVIHGQKFPDHWSRRKWNDITEQYQVFFMTSQLFLNCLRRGLLNFNEISMVVFDECHSNFFPQSSYNNIMREFYFPNYDTQQKKILPVIVGATASPVAKANTTTVAEIQDHLIQLCAHMDATFLDINLEDIKKYLKSAKVEFHPYQNHTLASLYSEDQRKQNQEQYSRSDLIMSLYDNFICPQFMQVFHFYKDNFHDVLGSKNDLCQDIYKQVYEYLIRKALVVLIEIGPYGYCLLVKQVLKQFKKIYQYKLQNTPQTPHQIHSLLDLLEQVDKNFLNIKIIDSLTPKFKSLITLLKEKIYPDLFTFKNQKDIYQVLVFCNQRMVAQLLSYTLDAVIKEELLNDKLKTNFIIGFNDPNRQSKSKRDHFDIVKMIEDDDNFVTEIEKTFQQHIQTELKIDFGDKVKFRDILELRVKADVNQMNIIEAFRQKQIQVLFATRVAEEGLDIPSSKYVIAYNFTESSKSFIQMKGRARMEDSSFILLIPEVGKQQQKKAEIQQAIQDTTKQTIRILQSNKGEFLSKIKEKQNDITKKHYYEQYLVQTTQANINTNWAYDLLNSLCYSSNRLNRRNIRPIFIVYVIGGKGKTQKYLSFVIIPRVFRSFVFKGDIKFNLSDAKKSVCFQACVRLYADGYLYDDLTPQYDNNIGLHTGGGEDDENIQKSQDLIKLLMSHQRTVIMTKSFNEAFYDASIKIIKIFYRQQNTLMFNLQEGPWVQVDITFKELKSNLYCSISFLELLQQSDINLVFGLKILGEKLIEEKEYEENLQAYKEMLQISLELLDPQNPNANQYKLIEGKYAFVYSKINFMDIQQTQEICKVILKILKTVVFYNKLQENLNNLTVYCPVQISQLHKNQNKNSLLNNLEEFKERLTINRQMLQPKPLDKTKLLKILNNPLFEVNKPLFQCLQFSLILDIKDQVKLYMGRIIYKLAISLQIFLSNPYLEYIISRQKSKYFQSSTYIKYKLIEKTNIFNYLHTDISDNTDLLYYPGLTKIVSEQDTNQYQSSISFQNIKNSQFFFFTNEDFSSFLYKTLFEIGINGNESFTQIYSFLQLVGIFNKQKGLVFRRMDEFFQNKHKFYPIQDKFNLEQYYNNIYENIGYEYNNFILLFQALTDVSFKQNILELVLPDLARDSKSKTEFIKVSKDLQSNTLFSLLDKINSYKIFNFSNDHFAFIGKYLWHHLVAQLILNSKQYKQIQDEDYFVLCHKKLIKNSTITYIACQLDLPLNINVDDIGPINQIYLCLKPQKYDYKMNFHNGHHEGFVIITKAFHALLGSIFIDSNGNYQLLYDLSNEWIYNRVKIQQFLELEFIKTEERWRFFKWYRQNIGNPLSFDLYKVPHQDYKNHKFNRLYIPYDKSKGEIGIFKFEYQHINLKQDKLTSITELHIFGPTKSYAWKKVMNFVPENF